MQQDPNSIISKILDIVDYQQDKKSFANDFIAACKKQAVIDLIKSLPEQAQTRLEQALAQNRDSQKATEVFKNSFSNQQFNKALEKATAKAFAQFLEKIIPTLSILQKQQLKIFLDSLT